jgi:uncharacterized protein YlaI
MCISRHVENLTWRLERTLEELLIRGFEPNERLEGLVDSFEGCETLLNYVGFSPIHILAAASLEASNHKNDLGEEEYLLIEGSISEIYEFLVKHGARISLDPPPENRRIVQSNINPGSKADTINKNCRNIQSSKEFSDVLGSYRLKTAEMAWKSMKPAESMGKYVLHTDKVPIEDSPAPGGSDEKSCSICWKAFGTLLNRKHRCRIARRYVCDECSSKRVVENGEEHRVSDGQFLLVQANATKEFASQGEENAKKDQTMSAAAARLDRLEAEEAANRNSLFGGIMENMGRAVFGDAEEESRTTSSDIQGLSASLDQTRDALNQRGEKLNTLAEKSDKLVEASRDFASMATELNKQSQKGLFW